MKQMEHANIETNFCLFLMTKVITKVKDVLKAYNLVFMLTF